MQSGASGGAGSRLWEHHPVAEQSWSQSTCRWRKQLKRGLGSSAADLAVRRKNYVFVWVSYRGGRRGVCNQESRKARGGLAQANPRGLRSLLLAGIRTPHTQAHREVRACSTTARNLSLQQAWVLLLPGHRQRC